MRSTSRVPGLDFKGTEVMVALTRMHRDQGRYLERIYKWAKRIGVPEVKAQIMGNPERRRHCFDRFIHSQKFAQINPWAERVEGKHGHEFRPLADLASPKLLAGRAPAPVPDAALMEGGC